LTPALVISLPAVRENLRRMSGYVESIDRWRPHVKTSKVPRLIVELLNCGVRHFKCATTRELEQLLVTIDQHDIRGADILLAYSVMGPALQRVCCLAQRHPVTRVSVLVEDAGELRRSNFPLGVFVDVDPGMERTGMPAEPVSGVVELCRMAGNRLRGLHWYEGHLNVLAGDARGPAAAASYRRLMDIYRACRDAGIEIPELVTSGTPTFRHALAFEPFRELEPTLHRVSPGTVVLHDHRTEQEVGDVDLLPAAIVLSRVVSNRAGRVTCDAGSKSISADAGSPCAYVLGHPELQALAPSEEHLPLAVANGAAAGPVRGELLVLVPRHVCTTVNLADRVVLLDHDRPPQIRDVSARAHEIWLDRYTESSAAQS
jgi:D-serine deaminase-like pyridoxal phosphate-dependent protein